MTRLLRVAGDDRGCESVIGVSGRKRSTLIGKDSDSPGIVHNISFFSKFITRLPRFACIGASPAVS